MRWAFPLLFGLAFSACDRARPAPSATPVVDALLELAEASGQDRAATTRARAELDRLARDVRESMARDRSLSASQALRRVVFESTGFEREVDDHDLRFVLLPPVLAQRRGSCVGLGSLYLALGERLDLTVAGVMVPGHFFVRVDESGTHRNIELLHRGEEMPDAWYSTRFPIPGGSAREYGRALTRSEVTGVIEYDIGNEQRRLGNMHAARRAFDRASRHFPDFAEAHASLGAVEHLLGALDDALLNYRAAQRANPNLPGLGQNIALLESERGARSP